MPLGGATGVDMPGAVWNRFHSKKHETPRIPGGRELGVAFLGDMPEGYFTYFAGAEVKPDAENPQFERGSFRPGNMSSAGLRRKTLSNLSR